MYLNLYRTVIVIFLTVLVQRSVSLECWKCIGDNCKDDPESNHEASKVTCMNNGVCMKVEYSMNTNDSMGILHSVVRTCSSGPCVPVSDEDYKKCTTTTKYLIDGCIRRSCCDDQKLCNSVPRTLISDPLVVTAAVIMVSMVIHKTNISS